MTVIETTELFSAIKEGYFDAALNKITEAVRSREFAVANQITIGDRVKITGTMKPKYLTGVTGTILSKDRRGFWVQMDKDHPNLAGRKYENYGEVGLPINCVSKLEA